MASTYVGYLPLSSVKCFANIIDGHKITNLEQLFAYHTNNYPVSDSNPRHFGVAVAARPFLLRWNEMTFLVLLLNSIFVKLVMSTNGNNLKLLYLHQKSSFYVSVSITGCNTKINCFNFIIVSFYSSLISFFFVI